MDMLLLISDSQGECNIIPTQSRHARISERVLKYLIFILSCTWFRYV